MLLALFLYKVGCLDFPFQVKAGTGMLDIDVRQQVCDEVVLLVQVVILETGYLQEELIVANKAAHGRDRLALFLVFVVVKQLFALLQEESQTLLLLTGDLFGVQDFVGAFNIRRIKKRVSVDLGLQVVNGAKSEAKRS